MKKETASAIVITLLIASMLFSATNFVKGQTDTPDLEVSLSSFSPSIINGTYNHLTNGSSTVLNATVTNVGNASASSVTLQLLVNGTVTLTAVTPTLDINCTFWAAYFWNPTDYVPPVTDYNLTVYALPVTNETNNNITRWIRVCPNQPPTAIFNMTWSPPNPPLGPVENQTVTFDASNSYNPPSTPSDWSTIVNYTWNFGDGPSVNYSYPTTTHKYTNWRNYTVTLTLVNNENLTSLPASQNISVYARPIANFTVLGKLYVNKNLTFNASTSIDPDNNATSTKGIASYNWDFGDGNTTTGWPNATILHPYNAEGNYTVTLNVTDFDGLVSDVVNESVYIGSGQPIAFFTPPHSPCYVGDNLTFDATNSLDLDNPTGPTRGIANYTWNFNDSTPIITVYVPTILHAFQSPGNYNVNLTVTDSDQGLTSWTNANVSVSYQVFLNATDSVTGSPNIAHNPGDYFNISITVTNVTDLFQYELNLTWPGTKSYPIFDSDPVAVSGGFLAQNATEDFVPTPSKYQGYVYITSTRLGTLNGVNGSGTLAIITLHVNGTMTGNCTFQIVSCLLQNSTFASINCTLGDGHFFTTKPVANFTYLPLTPTVNTEVYFNASNSYCPDGGNITSYQWDFGDGTSDTGPIVSHNYTSSEPFNVNLTVTDSQSLLTWSMNKTVEVNPGQVFITDIEPDELWFNKALNMFQTAGALPMNVTVTNPENTTVTFNVTVFFGGLNVTEQLVTDLPPGVWTLNLTCSITGINPGNYSIRAQPSCTNGTNSWTGPMCTNGTVRVCLASDVNGDYKVNMGDVMLILAAFGSKAGMQKYNAICDLNGDGKVDMGDIVIALSNFGHHYP